MEHPRIEICNASVVVFDPQSHGTFIFFIFWRQSIFDTLNVFCRRRETLLLRLNDVVEAACGVPATATLLKLTGYLYSLSQRNATDNNCTNCKTYICRDLQLNPYAFAD